MKCKRTVSAINLELLEPGELADTLNDLMMKNWQKLHRQKPIFFQHRQKPV